ncbi:hypothetical protein M9H77_36049 [Catharanthus roseus]|uniref:Uncharacterized protein n=1 Tax=Catharanthus roseus TaxID=4058 RepID=A0ACB9ZQR4_CATRO|nr:hypothetical protein M9H77_36049 [Catharanthus roseus]
MYDRRAKHDKDKNDINITRNGKRTTLKSLSSHQVCEEQKKFKERLRTFENEKRKKRIREELENANCVQEENDLEKNEQTKEMSEEKREFKRRVRCIEEETKQESRGRLGYNYIKQEASFLLTLTYHFTFLNSLGTFLERRYFIEFNSISCAILRVDDSDLNIANCVSRVLGVEDRRSMGKELGHILEDLSISLSLNPSSLCYEVSLDLFGGMCIIAFDGNLFLLIPSVSKYLSSHTSYKVEGKEVRRGERRNDSFTRKDL